MPINDYLQGINNATSGEKQDVNIATQDLSALQTGAGALPAKLKEALNLKLNNNKDIINQQSATMESYFNSGAQAREKYQDVWNPFEKAKLVQQDRSMALRPYDTLSGVLENRMGDVADITKAGVEGWQGMVNAATTKLGTAKDMLSTALQSYLKAADQQSAADDMAFKIAQAKEASRQFEQNYGLDLMKRNDQVDQFNKQLALSKLKLSGSGNGASAENTLSAWQKAVNAATDPATGLVNEQGVWNYINQNQDMLKKAGVNVDDLWSAHAKLVGSQPKTAAATTAPKTGYASTQLDLSTGKIPSSTVKSDVLQPGDPGYADLSKLKYLQGYNLGGR